MDSSNNTPKIFANQMIRLIVDQSFGEELAITPDDYSVMRVAFRNMDGKWAEISQGNHEHLNKLKQIVSAWGQEQQPQGKKRLV